MAVPSTMLPLGTTAPDFSLPDTVGHVVSRDDYAGRPALLVMFLSNHCPYVKHVAAELGRLGRDYGDRVGIVAIGANDIDRYPDDAPAASAEVATANGFTFPYLYDESQAVAQAYHAACTPDFFLFDGDDRLVYRGQLDSSRPSNDLPIDGYDLRSAIDAVLSDGAMPDPQLPSIGCNIKWKPGNEPDYYSLG